MHSSGLATGAKSWVYVLPALGCVLVAWRWSQVPDEDAGPLVRVEQGLLLGAHRTSHHGTPYFSFQGIPYAKPPLGELRFKAPLPPDNWTDVRPALEEGHMCCQPHTEIFWLPREYQKMEVPTSLRRVGMVLWSLPRVWDQIRRFWAQQEDCLFLNVYTKQLGDPTRPAGEAALSPVLVFIHGGAFFTGTANSHIYGPDNLLREDLVVVSLQYRLGALGFLAPGSVEAPGNAGLRDQQAALRWIQKNIAQFGGDPSRVTLMGHSAGGASVHYHTMAPSSAGLFHRAIQLSGCALNTWAFVEPEGASRRAHRLADLLGCEDCAHPDQVVAFLRTKSPRDLIEASYEVFQHQEGAAGHIAPFVPTVDGADGNLTGAFLRRSPLEALADGHFTPVPTLMGFNSAEGMITQLPDIITTDMAPSPRNMELLEEDFERVVPAELGLQRGSPESRRVAALMRQHYFPDGLPISKDTMLNFVQMYSDLLFTVAVSRYMRLLSAASTAPVFLYYFTYDGRLSVVKKLVNSDLPGVSHGDELGYLFPVEMLPAEDIRHGDEELDVRDRWTRIVANFAKSGAPADPADEILGVSWPPSTTNAPHFMDIGASLALTKGYPLNDSFSFWKTVFSSVGRDIV